jgi:serine/threonine protein kinase
MNLNLSFDSDGSSIRSVGTVSSDTSLNVASITEMIKQTENKLNNITSYDGKEYAKKLRKLRIILEDKYDIVGVCRELKNVSESGSFGSVSIDTEMGTVSKLTDLMSSLKNDLNDKGLLVKESILKNTYNKIRRLIFFCEYIEILINKMNKLFPENTIKMLKCGECIGQTKNSSKILKYYMKMELAKGKNLAKIFKMNKLSDDDIKKIEVQLIYIGETLNDNDVFHNDFAPRNIMIDLSKKKDVSYNSNKKYNLKVKNTYVPVLIDYDLIDNKVVRYTDSGERDMDIYTIDTMSKNFDSYSFELYDEWKENKNGLNNITDVFISKKQSGGKKSIRKSSRSKNIRKHKGINQKTGRLNKGYRYSGKKLRSGLSEIVKISKK